MMLKAPKGIVWQISFLNCDFLYPICSHLMILLLIKTLNLSVVVRDLFHNQPVRRKYMQSRFFFPYPSISFNAYDSLDCISRYTCFQKIVLTDELKLEAQRRFCNQSRKVCCASHLCVQISFSKLLILKGMLLENS